eukprot:4044085-Heterocapsa_arctica.AAC.1
MGAEPSGACAGVRLRARPVPNPSEVGRQASGAHPRANGPGSLAVGQSRGGDHGRRRPVEAVP